MKAPSHWIAKAAARILDERSPRWKLSPGPSRSNAINEAGTERVRYARLCSTSDTNASPPPPIEGDAVEGAAGFLEALVMVQRMPAQIRVRLLVGGIDHTPCRVRAARSVRLGCRPPPHRRRLAERSRVWTPARHANFSTTITPGAHPRGLNGGSTPRPGPAPTTNDIGLVSRRATSPPASEMIARIVDGHGYSPPHLATHSSRRRDQINKIGSCRTR